MLLYPCNTTKQLYSKLQYFVSQNLNIPEINPQSALFGFSNIDNQKHNFLLINHLVLFLEHYLYMSREQGTFCFTNLKLYLIKIKIIEKKGKMLKKRESHWKYSKINTRLEFFIYFSFS